MMTTELTILGWTLVLTLLQVLLASSLRSMETGLSFSMSARDTEPTPPGRMTARAQRAQRNLFETLPLFIAAVLIAHGANIHSSLTVLGCWLYLGARVVYVPLYVFGVPVLRSLVWAVSLAGLLILFWSILS